MHKSICKPCAIKAKANGYLVHHLPPYLLNQRNKVRCYLCGEMRVQHMWLNMELRNHPRRVREVNQEIKRGDIRRIDEDTQAAVDAALAVSVGLDNIRWGRDQHESKTEHNQQS